MRHPVAGRSREGGPAEPGAEAGVRTGSPTHGSTSPAASHDGAVAATSGSNPLTEVQILVGTALWLVDLRDRLAEQLDLAEGATLAMPRATLEAMRDGLTRCAGWLDTLTVDPARLPAPDRAPARAPTPAVHAPTTPSPRKLQ